MSKPHLVLKDVHRHYGEGDTIVRVLEAANLTVKSGELVALVAPSGAGKSTLLHLSGLLESPQGGEIDPLGSVCAADVGCDGEAGYLGADASDHGVILSRGQGGDAPGGPEPARRGHGPI